MQTGVKQVFYFNAGANALGGYVEEPFSYIPTPCSVALSPTGGRVSSLVRSQPGALDVAKTVVHGSKEVARYKAAYTFVSGRPAQMNGPWSYRVVSIIEGLSILGRITADHLVAHVSIHHPALSEGPDAQRKFSFAGSQFTNLRVDGKPITPVTNPTLLPPQRQTFDPYNQDVEVPADIPWSNLWATAYRQGTTISKDTAAPSWTRDRYGWVVKTDNPSGPNPAGYSICSLVDSINGIDHAPNAGHAFELPDVGRVFLGEILVHPSAMSLSMLRVELGCPVQGQISIASVIGNGEGCPPN